MAARHHSLCQAALALWLAAPAAGQGAARVDFERDIRPILADRCFACHGPDARARKAGLRLDRRDSAVATRTDPSRAIIDPGHPERSELFRRITSTDPDQVMPRPKSKLPRLDPDQIDLVRRWIDEGAAWGEHWSFEELPRSVAVPETPAPGHPVDAFVSRGLARVGLQPAARAERRVLIRRVSLDLTGLPPSPSEVEAFVADQDPDAFEKVVDRLLDSAHYGERMASTWLDAARYADSLGYQTDRGQRVWPWRDWVVRAFNDNLPYDEFTTWQIAGDLLPDATRDQRLATTFNRLHRQTEEGGTVPEEFRTEYVADRVNTFGTAFLGITLGCARCHDHKFDPISQADYYRLFAFFNNIDESGQTSHFTNAVPVPTLPLTDADTTRELLRLANEIEAAEQALARARDDAEDAFDQWRRSPPPEVKELRGAVASLSLDVIDDKQQLANAAAPERPARAVDAPAPVAGRVGGGLLLNGENGVQLDKACHFTRSDPFSIAIWVRAERRASRAVIVHKSQAGLDAGSRGYQIVLEDGRVTACLAHMWPHNSAKIATRAELPVGRWVHLLMTYDGSSKAAGLNLYLDGELQPVDVVRDGLTRDIVYHRIGAPPLRIGHRFRDRGFAGGQVDELIVFDRCLTELEAAELVHPGAIERALAMTPPGTALRDHYLATVDPTCAEHVARLRALRDAERKVSEGVPQIMTMIEQSSARPTFVLNRGAYDQPGQRVTPGTPASLPPFGQRPTDRLGLARWLFQPDHPLTARVAVNRLWQQLFGRGLVATPEDLGSQGSPPTHPELLDWLSRRFVESGWDTKALIRLLTTSETYQRSSVTSAATREVDPENMWLGRAPRYRWPAEMIRDSALAAAGLLVTKLGGPPVRPYQPPGLWQEKSVGSYSPSKGGDLYRRTLYTYWKRTSPPPSMILFDMPRRNECAVSRQRTATPLQALVLLNDPQFVECARALAQRVMTERESLDGRVTRIYELVLGRKPEPSEMTVMTRLFHEQLEDYAAHPAQAKALLETGELPSPPELPLDEVAATSVLAQTLLCYDEALTKR